MHIDQRVGTDYGLWRALVVSAMTIWGWIQEHETLSAGITGFSGVIAVLVFNAWQERQQRRNEQRHERQTLRVALIEELKIHRESLSGNVDTSKQSQKDSSGTVGAYVPTDPMDDAYKAFTSRIGLLSQSEVGKVMFAYLSLRTYYAKLFIIGEPPHTGDRNVQIPPENLSLLTGIQDGLVEPIDEAIKVMEDAQKTEGRSI